MSMIEFNRCEPEFVQYLRTMSEISHIDAEGKVNMVNVGAKESSVRIAIAEAKVTLPDSVVRTLVDKELHLPKGPVFQTAIIAGIMAAKKTGELIPLCHPLGLDYVNVVIKLSNNVAVIQCTAQITAKTGVEMEALTGASVAALTIYDMCKALSHDIVISEIKLIEKSGGKNDFKRNS